MIILPTLFGDKDEIEILSPSPQALRHLGRIANVYRFNKNLNER